MESVREDPGDDGVPARGNVFKLDGVAPHVNAAASRIIGAAIEVHRHLGPGFLEIVYERALGMELARRSIPFQNQAPITVAYKGDLVGEGRVDLLVEACVIVELKAVEAIAGVHIAQLRSYLHAADLQLGLILNFNVPKLSDGGIRRVVNL